MEVDTSPVCRYTRGNALGMIGMIGASLFFPTNTFARTTDLSSADHPPLRLGSDRFITELWPELSGSRIGLVTNQTGRLSDGRRLLSAIMENPAIELRALYSPEHGLLGNHQAGGTVASTTDIQTNLPVYSLYGKTKRPTLKMLQDVDVLLFDIQDVGARTYTYISTLAMVMQAAAQYGKSVWVLDRPNPIGGTIVEGPVLDPRFASFVGLYPLPMRHGMTIGEIALLYQKHFGIDCDLKVIGMQGYMRDMLWPATGLHWFPTSPNIPYFRTALVYLTTGPLSGAGINNGIGSGHPFEYALSSLIKGQEVAAVLNARHLPGVRFLPVRWTPTTGYWANTPLHGVAILVEDAARFLAVRTGLEILTAVRQVTPEALHLSPTLDRDWGTDSLRNGLSDGLSAAELESLWEPRMREFMLLRRGVLLYS